ncbi:efflux RND transporter periplasmic adaptor subunit [Sporosalibacterium faouarense]|uniref:efflux RND transporter periplasmic adaptor subunit n=1 Tax=Sporosalibacterium faouarense TaxID=516123 RepID=UPI00192C5A2B|nr:efflux RND transporter periplasmic adaptor subunit [Sporosalibacterium faouarense]
MKKFIASKKSKIIIAVVLILVAGLVARSVYKGKADNTMGQNIQEQVTSSVQRGNIRVKITGIGTAEPASMYEINPLVKGNILESPYKAGAKVKKGDLLYRIDDSDLLNEIEKTKNSIEQLKLNNEDTFESLENLVIKAPISGRIENLEINEDEDISGGKQIADIINYKRIKATIPFNEEQIKQIKVGQNAQILISQYMTYLDGSISYVSNIGRTTEKGISIYDVEVIFDNPGAIKEGMKVSGIIKGENGDIESPYEGETQYIEKESIIAETGGTVEKIYVKNNDWVEKGDKLLELENRNVENSMNNYNIDYKDLHLTLDSQKKELENYNIISPIDGIIVEKNFKEGDTVNTSSSSKALMTVADMSKMVFTIEVDELDIDKVEIGQQVDVRPDAFAENSFVGEVTNIAVIGSSQNGVTTYPVEITINEPGNLRPGMNVTAEILVAEKNDILIIPMAAVSKMGGKHIVYLADSKEAEKNSGDKQEVENEGMNAGIPQPEGTPVEVELGINDANFVEVISGLSEGDMIYVPNTTMNMGGGNQFPRRRGSVMIGGW